jgi:hypothetical protein
MRSVRFGRAMALATLLAACSHHPIKIGPVSLAQPAPARPLVETPAPAVVPLPPTPVLKPGTGLSLEAVRASGDGNLEAPPAGATATGGPQAPEAASLPETGTTPTGPAATQSVPTMPSLDDPDHLIGLSEEDAVRLLGEPKARAETPPSRVWTYSSTNCDLRLYFYPEIGGTSYRTLTYEIDDRDPTDTNRRNCVGGLLKNHAG